MSNDRDLHGPRISEEAFNQLNNIEPARSTTPNVLPRRYPKYLTGESELSPFIPDYPVAARSPEWRDPNARALMKQNNHDVMLLTLLESIEFLAYWNQIKRGWVTATQSSPGSVLINYGTYMKDTVTTAMVISMLGGVGVRATLFLNHKGTELIKITGYAGLRKMLNAPVYAARNIKIVDVGIGKYGVQETIIKGARLTFYIAAAINALDFILNDETTLAKFIGSLATDVAKIGITTALTLKVGAAVSTMTSLIAPPLGIAIAVGVLTTYALREFDNKFGITDKVVSFIETAFHDTRTRDEKINSGISIVRDVYFNDIPMIF